MSEFPIGAVRVEWDCALGGFFFNSRNIASDVMFDVAFSLYLLLAGGN